MGLVVVSKNWERSCLKKQNFVDGSPEDSPMEQRRYHEVSASFQLFRYLSLDTNLVLGFL